MRCPGCRKEFAFEPQKRDLLTDTAFQTAIDAVSAKGRVRWGVEHLYYEICRRAKRRRVPRGVYFVVFVLAGILGVATGMLPAALLLGGLVELAIWWSARRARAGTVALPLEKFNDMWARWRKVHGTPKGVIERKEPAPRPRASEPDLGDYSFDRAVICDRARTVDLLLANNFHFENNCAVLSIGGYPPGPFETVRAMLKHNPKLQVFALHDASPAGCQLAQKLATDPAWFGDQVPVTDVGLRPSHAGPFRGVWLPSASGAVPASDGITTNEVEWLSRYALELAAIRPEQVLKRLFRALNRKADSDEDSTSDSSTSDTRSGVQEDSDSFKADAADADGGPDSFG